MKFERFKTNWWTIPLSLSWTIWLSDGWDKSHGREVLEGLMGLWCFQRDMTSAQPAMFVIAAGKCSETSYMLFLINEKKNLLFVAFLCCYPFLSFRDLVILTKFCQTRSIGSPDAFFQFPLKCFQQRLPFLLLKKHLAKVQKIAKERTNYPLPVVLAKHRVS